MLYMSFLWENMQCIFLAKLQEFSNLHRIKRKQKIHCETKISNYPVKRGLSLILSSASIIIFFHRK